MAERLGPPFARAESRQRALADVRGRLSPLARQHGWPLAEPAGERHPDTCPHRLNRATWSAEAVRDDLRPYVSASLGDPQAVLVVEETGVLKNGRQAAGVARQDSGTAGTIDTCHIGVFLAYARPKGRTWLARELFLPPEWRADQDRGQAAGLPTAVQCPTTPPWAHVRRERALAAGVPAQWVTGDAVDGPDRPWRLWLERWPPASGMAVPAHAPVWPGCRQRRVQALSAPLVADAWPRRSAGDGAKGPRRYDWAVVPRNPPWTPGWCRWRRARRRLEVPTDLAYDVAYAPEPPPARDGPGGREPLEHGGV
jgi:SRSO17 transposase